MATNSTRKRKLSSTVGFKLDPQSREVLERQANLEGLSSGAYARQATLDRLARVEEEVSVTRQIEGFEVLLHEISTRLSISTEVILKMLADSEIGGMNVDQIEAWIAERLPRPGRRTH